jgi:halocyanin-like protein
MRGMMHGERSAGPPDAPFDGEEGAARCRAMMGAMDDMHRSMQSMMQRHRGDSATLDSADRRSGRGHGMMGERMGHGGGSMDDRGGHIDMEGMSMGEMRRLCQTMQATMQDVMHGYAPGDTDGSPDGSTSGELDPETQTERWLGQACGFEEVDDHTGESEVVIDVGAGTGLSHAPEAVRVDPGTTVRWRWTGQGGLHDVSFTNADVRTSLKGESGATFAHTLGSPGQYRHECIPHSGVGMRGAIIVEEE